MIQITPQMRILAAVGTFDFRCGIDGLARLCRKHLNADPYSSAELNPGLPCKQCLTSAICVSKFDFAPNKDPLIPLVTNFVYRIFDFAPSQRLPVRIAYAWRTVRREGHVLSGLQNIPNEVLRRFLRSRDRAPWTEKTAPLIESLSLEAR